MDINKYYAEEYDPLKTYNKNGRCVFNGQWYECLADNTTGDFDADKWVKRYLVDYLRGSSAPSDNKWSEWATNGGIDVSLYNDLGELLADEIAVRNCL